MQTSHPFLPSAKSGLLLSSRIQSLICNILSDIRYPTANPHAYAEKNGAGLQILSLKRQGVTKSKKVQINDRGNANNVDILKISKAASLSFLFTIVPPRFQVRTMLVSLLHHHSLHLQANQSKSDHLQELQR